MNWLNQEKGFSKEAFITLVEKERERLYRVAYGYLKNESLALEALDEAIYIFYKERKKLREPTYALTYVTRILINECLRIIRQQKKLVYEVPEHFQEGVEDAVVSISTKVALDMLPEHLRQVIVLRYFAELTIKETASILDAPEGTIASWTKQALKLLKLELSDEKGARIL